jgi:pimeloyl-ACP methyl ester carboxylesterase
MALYGYARVSVVERAGCLPQPIGEKVLLELVRYDVGRLAPSLDRLRVPVMAIQSTFSNERRERRSMTRGQTTPYLDMLRARVQSVRIEIIEDTGHFPQIDEPDRTNALIDDFHANLLARGSGIAV